MNGFNDSYVLKLIIVHYRFIFSDPRRIETFDKQAAGLLTFASSYSDPFPHQRIDAVDVILSYAITVAGTVSDFHRIPY